MHIHTHLVCFEGEKKAQKISLFTFQKISLFNFHTYTQASQTHAGQVWGVCPHACARTCVQEDDSAPLLARISLRGPTSHHIPTMPAMPARSIAFKVPYRCACACWRYCAYYPPRCLPCLPYVCSLRHLCPRHDPCKPLHYLLPLHLHERLPVWLTYHTP